MGRGMNYIDYVIKFANNLLLIDKKCRLDYLYDSHDDIVREFWRLTSDDEITFSYPNLDVYINLKDK